MNSFESYIRNFYPSIPYPRYKEDQDILELFFPKRNNFDVLEVFSHSVFPQYIKFGDENKFIWNGVFWDFFERYLFAIAVLENDAKVNLISDFSEYFESIFLMFLSLITTPYPALSYVIATKYYKLTSKIPHYNLKESPFLNDFLIDNGYSELMLNSKMFVAFHELYHFVFQTDEKAKNETFKTIREICIGLSEKSWGTESRLDDIFLEAKNNKSYFEDLCCDCKAIFDSIIFLEDIHPDTSKFELYKRFMNHISYVISLQTNFDIISNYYKILYKGFVQKEKTFDEIRKNMDLLPIDSMIREEACTHIVDCLFYNMETTDLSIKFFHSDIYEKYVLSTVKRITSPEYIADILFDYECMKKSFSNQQFFDARNMLIGWY